VTVGDLTESLTDTPITEIYHITFDNSTGHGTRQSVQSGLGSRLQGLEVTAMKRILGAKQIVRLGISTLALVAWCSFAPAAQQSGPHQVDLKLVLATDVSGSISDEELQLEREGTAEAFLDPVVIKAIQTGSLGRIAVSMIDFSSQGLGKVVIDWQIVHDKNTATAFAETVRDLPRTPGRRTSVSSALELGSLLIESSDKDIVATRKVIDVSGDGPNNDGNPMTETHDRIVAQGIVVNGLPIMDDNANGYYPDLDKYYAGCVVGGRGAFVVVVRKYADYATGMRHKLVLEISQNESLIKQATAPNKALITGVAMGPTANGPATQPEVLRPTNDYPGGCDIQGGLGGFGFRRF
jgi:hypothetical protein